MNNFKKIDIFIDSLLIIDYNNDLLTIKVADNIIIPSQDILRLNLTLKFDSQYSYGIDVVILTTP